MNHKTTLYFVMAVIMLTSIIRAFAMDRDPSIEEGAMRSVDISGNIFHFSMPENFSSDMPARDIVGKIDIDSKNFKNSYSTKVIAQRWWDIKKSGFFGKDLGSLMMNITVHQKPPTEHPSEHGETMSKLDFMLIIDEHMAQHYTNLNNVEGERQKGSEEYSYSGFSFYGDQIISNFNERIANQQLWLHHGGTGPNGLLTAYYSIPITPETFIEVQFLHAPNHGSAGWEFLNKAKEIMTTVVDSFHINYAPDNPIKNSVEKHWQSESVDEIVEKNQDRLRLLAQEILHTERHSLPSKE